MFSIVLKQLFSRFSFSQLLHICEIETISLIRSNQKRSKRDEKGSLKWLFENSFYILSPGTRFLIRFLVIILKVVVWGVHLGSFLWHGIFNRILFIHPIIQTIWILKRFFFFEPNLFENYLNGCNVPSSMFLYIRNVDV